MEPPDLINNMEKKIKSLEMELNDLRQGLSLVTDYYTGLQREALQQDAVEAVDQTITKPLADEDIEFEAIWQFHEKALLADPSAHIPCTAMYEAFARYCTQTGRRVVAQDAFEFVFAHIENPAPILDRGEWIGYRLLTGSG